MQFLADMGVSLGVVDWLRDNGHDAIHLRDQGLQRASDEEVFDRLRDAIEQTAPALEQDAVVVVEETRMRVRHLSLGS